MKRFFLCLMAASAITSTVFAVPFSSDSIKSQDLSEVYVIGNKAGAKTPVAQTNMSAQDIALLPTASNIPHVLWMTPSLVAFSENGTGSGNSYLRIRGVDASRINVTINGIPQNNPETQEMFWVDVPDLASGVQSIQIQRGVGTSTNGSASFGGSINMTTRNPEQSAYFQSIRTVGSYATFQENIATGTGILNNGLSFDLRYSKLLSDGYIRNGWLDHESLFASAAKRFEKGQLRFNYIYGREKTGITWEGITQEQFDTDPTYNPAGARADGSWYDNESDNYWQHHFQLFYNQELKKNFVLNAGLNYTNGFGYYQQYKLGKKFSSMGLANQTVDSISYSETDLIRRKNMANDYYIGTLNLMYQHNAMMLQGGGMYSIYTGDHYANLLWVSHNENIPANFEWVRNHASKSDANVYLKAEYAASGKLNTWVDLQYRAVNYQLKGLDDDDMSDFTQTRNWKFFNPKAGLFYQLTPQSQLFGSVALAHREPTRADIKDSRKSGNLDAIKAERMTDVELGYTFDNQVLMLRANLYGMFYKDQLVATGKLNDVGYALMSNVPTSFREGVELQAGYKPTQWLQLDANTTVSRNKVEDYTVYFETYDNSSNWGDATSQLSRHFNEMTLPYSPELIAALGFTVQPFKELSLHANFKHVGTQYMTNSQNEDLKLPAYQHANLSATYNFKMFNKLSAQIALYCDNVLSQKYACNGWGYEAHFENGDPVFVDKGLYVAAPRNYLAKFTLKFE